MKRIILSEEERREKQREYSRRYRAAHPEEIAAYQRAYRKAHPEKFKTYMMRFYAKHPEAAARAAAFLDRRRRLREHRQARLEETILHEMEKRGYFV